MRRRRSRLYYSHEGPPLTCSLCDRTEDEVDDLLVTRHMRGICDQCVTEANAMIARRRHRRPRPTPNDKETA